MVYTGNQVKDNHYIKRNFFHFSKLSCKLFFTRCFFAYVATGNNKTCELCNPFLQLYKTHLHLATHLYRIYIKSFVNLKK
jgi:hypothetical protein